MVGAAMGFAARGAVAVPFDLRLLPDSRGRLHPDVGHLVRQRQAGRVARRHLDRRGRPVADGARGSVDDAGGAGLRGALSVRSGQHRAARRGDGPAQGPGLHADVAAKDAGDLRPRRDVPDRRLEGPAPERRGRRDGGRRRRHGVRGAQGLRSALRRGHRTSASSTRTRSSRSTPRRSLRRPGRPAAAIITVEDHYASGGLGDAVSEAISTAGFAVRRLAVREIPRSGQPDELLDRYGISARHVVEAVKALL